MNQTRWQKIETLYYAALEKSLEDRARFLADECNGDEELCAEVNSLLSSQEQADSFLAEPEFDLYALLLIAMQ